MAQYRAAEQLRDQIRNYSLAFELAQEAAIVTQLERDLAELAEYEALGLDTDWYFKKPLEPVRPRPNRRGEYEVRRIIGKRDNEETGVPEYLVEWIGYGKADNTWEPADFLVKCKEAIDDYERLAKARKDGIF